MALTDHPRILYVITDPISIRFLRGQMRYLVDAGLEVHLACRAGDHTEAFGRSESVTVHQVALTREPSPQADIRGLVDLVRLIRRLRPAIVNASTPKAGLLGTLAARICRVPVRIYLVRGFRFEAQSGCRRAILRFLEYVASRNATHVLFNSPSLRAIAEQERVVRTGRGIVLGGGSGNGIETSRFIDGNRRTARIALGIGLDREVVGFVGRLTHDKGILDLLEVFDSLATDRPCLELLLIGDYEEGDPLDSVIRSRVRHDPRITAPGWMEDPAQVYAAMDILAFPSYREGLPNVPLEAQASQVPVVGYAATGTIDAVLNGKTGVLVDIGDVTALGAAVGALLDEPQRRQAMAESGRLWVAKEFASQRIWDELLVLYTHALS